MTNAGRRNQDDRLMGQISGAAEEPGTDVIRPGQTDAPQGQLSDRRHLRAREAQGLLRQHFRPPFPASMSKPAG